MKAGHEVINPSEPSFDHAAVQSGRLALERIVGSDPENYNRDTADRSTTIQDPETGEFVHISPVSPGHEAYRVRKIKPGGDPHRSPELFKRLKDSGKIVHF